MPRRIMSLGLTASAVPTRNADLTKYRLDEVHAYEEFRLKEFERDRDGTWVDEIPDRNDHSTDTVRYAVMDDVLRGA